MALKLFKYFLVFAFFACALTLLVSTIALLAQWQYLMAYAYGILPNAKAGEISKLLVAVPVSAAMLWAYSVLLPMHRAIFEALTDRN